jgi:hypothetical protein
MAEAIFIYQKCSVFDRAANGLALMETTIYIYTHTHTHLKMSLSGSSTPLMKNL